MKHEKLINAQEFHAGACTRSIGPRGGITERVEIWRRSGVTKLWKTRPGEFKIPVKFGLYSNGYITNRDAGTVHVPEDCPLLKTEGAIPHVCKNPLETTCGNCSRSWCDRCDPVAVSALCHWCNGRGYSTAPIQGGES